MHLEDFLKAKRRVILYVLLTDPISFHRLLKQRYLLDSSAKMTSFPVISFELMVKFSVKQNQRKRLDMIFFTRFSFYYSEQCGYLSLSMRLCRIMHLLHIFIVFVFHRTGVFFCGVIQRTKELE